MGGADICMDQPGGRVCVGVRARICRNDQGATAKETRLRQRGLACCHSGERDSWRRIRKAGLRTPSGGGGDSVLLVLLCSGRVLYLGMDMWVVVCRCRYIETPTTTKTGRPERNVAQWTPN